MKKLTLREQQLIELNILKYFHQICLEHEIQYSLGGGTLIGAVRHKGFIPWDDDIDVYMLRNEYEKFVRVWNTQSHGQYVLSLAEDIHGALAGEMSKIFDTNTFIIDTMSRKTGIFIDIFIWDGVPNHPTVIYKAMKKHRRLKLRLSSCKKRWYRANKDTLMYRVFMKLSYYFFNKMMHHLASFQQQFPIDKMEYIGLFLSDYGGWEKSYMYKDYFSHTVDLEFEGEYFPVMNGYHEHLTMYYGDYMQLPPVETRVPNHIAEAYLIESDK